MINNLIDEPMDLNQKALNLLSNFKFWDEKNYIGYNIAIFKKENDEDVLKELEKKSFNCKTVMEKDFKSILLDELNLILIDSLSEATRLDANFMSNYIEKRDLSQLIIVSLSLECLRTYFYKLRTFHLRDGNEMIMGRSWHSLDTAREEYEACKDFMKNYCPEALNIHIKAIEINKDLL